MDPWKSKLAQNAKTRNLIEIIADADVFLDLSAGGVLKPGMPQKIAPQPLVLALANPTPEIMPEAAQEARPDAVICTVGKDSQIPAPFDPRLILRVASAVAGAAMDSGVAARPIADFDAYLDSSSALCSAAFDTAFYAAQILELAAGATNLAMMGLNIRDGLTLTSRIERALGR